MDLRRDRDQRWHGHGLGKCRTQAFWFAVPSRSGPHAGRDEDSAQFRLRYLRLHTAIWTHAVLSSRHGRTDSRDRSAGSDRHLRTFRRCGFVGSGGAGRIGRSASSSPASSSITAYCAQMNLSKSLELFSDAIASQCIAHFWTQQTILRRSRRSDRSGRKRKIIGRQFIEIFEAEAARLGRRQISGPGHALSRRDRKRCRAEARRRRSKRITTSAACRRSMRLRS